VSDELSKTTRKWYEDKKKTCERGWYVCDSSQKVLTVGHLGEEGEIRNIAQRATRLERNNQKYLFRSIRKKDRYM
jgi:hypothetical protein